MSNLSIQPLLNGAASNPAERRGRADGDAADRNDPVLAFNEVMRRHDPREAPARAGEAPRPRTAEPERPAQRTPPTDGAWPAEPAIKRDAAGGSRPIARSERGEPVDEAAGTPARGVTNTRAATSGPTADPAAAEAPDTATGDLFAQLGLALAAAGKMAGAPADSAGTAVAAGDAGDAADPVAVARPVASTLALAPAMDSGTEPAQRGAPIDDRADIGSTRPGARAPRGPDGGRAGPAPSMSAGDAAQQSLPIDARPDGHAGIESEFAGLAASLDARGAPAARSEPLAGTPLSLSAALSASPGAALGPVAVPATYSIAHAQVGTAMGARGFGDEFSQRVMLLAGQRVQFAEIALTPADLGPIGVTVEVRGQEASLVFGAAQSATRQAIEDALPRLREMFQAHGLHLVDAHVGAQLGHHGRRDNTPGGAARDALAARTAPLGEVQANSTPATASVLAHSNRLIDVRV